jgi:hypothetical protein
MATLEDQIAADLRAIVASENLIDMSNQRDDDTAEDTTRTDRVAALAAANVKEVLGESIDGDDLQAVDFGVRTALLKYNVQLGLRQSEQGQAAWRDLRQEMRDTARARRQKNSAPVLDTPDPDDINSRFPHSTWEE